MATSSYFTPEYNPLFANFCRAGIVNFLKDDSFEHLLTELNLVEEWYKLKSRMGLKPTSSNIDFVNTFHFLWQYIIDDKRFSSDKDETFIRFFIEFARWNKSEVDVKPVIKDLKELYMSDELISNLKRDIAKINKSKPKNLPSNQHKVDLKRVFIIHGHDKAARLELEKILRDDLKLQPVVLQETSGESMDTIFSKFEREANSCGVAIALFTPDDETKNGKYRPRQNAILELGYFWGRPAVQKRIIILKKGDIETPSNIFGVETIEFTKSVEDVYAKLKRQLERWKILNT